MIVTAIDNGKKDKYSIYIEGDFAFVLSGDNVKKFNIHINEEISNDTYKFIVNEIVLNEAKKRILNYIGFKPRTQLEAEMYLKKHLYNIEIIEEVINFLKRYKYIDDYQYAKFYIESKNRQKPLGKKGLNYYLYNKGINNEIVEQVLEEICFNEEELAFELLNKKIKKQTKIDLKIEKKLYTYLTQRGFQYKSIKKAIKKYKNSLNCNSFL